MTDREVAPTLNEAAARGLDRITRATITASVEAIKLTFLSKSWRHLGFGSFEAWASDMPKFQLSRDEQRRVILEMDGVGMSQRQIAAAVGVAKTSVQRHVGGPKGPSSTTAPDQVEPPSGPKGPRKSPARSADLHQAASGIPETDRGFRSNVNSVISMLDLASVERNVPITNAKVEEARRLFDAMEQCRQEWLPYMSRRPEELR